MNEAKNEAIRYDLTLRRMQSNLERMQNRLERITPDRIKTGLSWDLDVNLQNTIDVIDEILDGIDLETGYLKN